MLPPGRQSAGRAKAATTGQGNLWLGGTLGEAATGAARTKTFLASCYRRIVKRRSRYYGIRGTDHQQDYPPGFRQLMSPTRFWSMVTDKDSMRPRRPGRRRSCLASERTPPPSALSRPPTPPWSPVSPVAGSPRAPSAAGHPVPAGSCHAGPGSGQAWGSARWCSTLGFADQDSNANPFCSGVHFMASPRCAQVTDPSERLLSDCQRPFSLGGRIFR